MASTIGRGLLAGAFGTVLLNATTYLDMALTGRRASTAPGETVLRLADSAGYRPPDDPPRREAHGQLAGLATGLGVGGAAAPARACGVRLPAPLGAAATGAVAMAATDAPMSLTGTSDPGSWAASDWVRDAVAHLVYGAGVRWALDRTEDPRDRPVVVRAPATPTRRGPAARRQAARTPGLLARSFGLGMAAGGRSSAGLGVPAVLAGGRAATLAGAAMVTSELVVDKRPSMPSRLEPGPAAFRLGSGAAGGVALARREGAHAALPALVGTVGAATGTLLGLTWRQVAADHGLTWQAALAEDAATLALAAGCWRRGGA
jgi:uncharacterized membrane protein